MPNKMAQEFVNIEVQIRFTDYWQIILVFQKTISIVCTKCLNLNRKIPIKDKNHPTEALLKRMKRIAICFSVFYRSLRSGRSKKAENKDNWSKLNPTASNKARKGNNSCCSKRKQLNFFLKNIFWQNLVTKKVSMKLMITFL